MLKKPKLSTFCCHDVDGHLSANVGLMVGDGLWATGYGRRVMGDGLWATGYGNGYWALGDGNTVYGAPKRAIIFYTTLL